MPIVVPVRNQQQSVVTVQRERHTTLSLFFLLLFSCSAGSSVSAGRSTDTAHEVVSELEKLRDTIKSKANREIREKYVVLCDQEIAGIRERWLSGEPGQLEYKAGAEDPIRLQVGPLVAELACVMKENNITVVDRTSPPTRFFSHPVFIVSLLVVAAGALDAGVSVYSDWKKWRDDSDDARKLSIVVRDALKKSRVARFVHEVRMRCGFAAQKKKKQRARVQGPAPVLT